MTALAQLEAKVAELERSAEKVAALVRDAHAATKDLRSALKEARDFMSSKAVVDRLDAAVGDGLASYTGQIKKATEEATAAVFKRYDDLAAILLDSMGKHGISFVDFAAELKAKTEEATS